jgi:quercetin dioxygenase-like cupin family protein
MSAHHARQIVRGADEGQAVALLGGLYSYRAEADETGGAYSVFQVDAHRGFGAPRHLHHALSEGFYVVDGEVTLLIGEEQFRARRGTFALAPAGVPHAFRFDSPEARLLLLIAPGDGEHEALFREMGEPGELGVIPPLPSTPPDVEELARIAARHGTQIVGPPPGME